MRKVTSNNLTVGMVSTNFRGKIKDSMASDQAFINYIKGTPAYWKKVFLWCFNNGKTTGLAQSLLWYCHSQIYDGTNY